MKKANYCPASDAPKRYTCTHTLQGIILHPIGRHFGTYFVSYYTDDLGRARRALEYKAGAKFKPLYNLDLPETSSPNKHPFTTDAGVKYVLILEGQTAIIQAADMPELALT